MYQRRRSNALRAVMAHNSPLPITFRPSADEMRAANNLHLLKVIIDLTSCKRVVRFSDLVRYVFQLHRMTMFIEIELEVYLHTTAKYYVVRRQHARTLSWEIVQETDFSVTAYLKVWCNALYLLHK